MDFLFNSPKRIFGILFIICFGMMAVALFMEHFLSLKPCMLCYMQRGAVLILGLIAALGYLINPNDKATEYFAEQVRVYLKNMEQKKHIEKIFFVTFPQKKNFNKTYKLDVSDVIKNVVKDKKNITHINFSEILLDDKNFDYENVWLEDQIHLNWENHANIFIKKILEELSKYLL